MLLYSGTWKEMVEIHRDTRVLPSGTTLRIMRHTSGRFVRFKSRLLARGSLQSDPVSYAELYAPVACIELARIVLSEVAAKIYCVHQVDVKRAFL